MCETELDLLCLFIVRLADDLLDILVGAFLDIFLLQSHIHSGGRADPT